MSDTEQWEFVTNGGCERCDAMVQVYDYEPSRPHPNCQCIVRRYWPGDGNCHRDVAEVWVDHDGNDHMSGTDDSFELIFNIEIECPDGTTSQIEFRREIDYAEFDARDIDDVFMEFLMDAYDHADDWAQANCPPCVPRLVG